MFLKKKKLCDVVPGDILILDSYYVKNKLMFILSTKYVNRKNDQIFYPGFIECFALNRNNEIINFQHSESLECNVLDCIT